MQNATTGAKARVVSGLYAALKCRSSTVLHGFVSLTAASGAAPFQREFPVCATTGSACTTNSTRLACEFRLHKDGFRLRNGGIQCISVNSSCATCNSARTACEFLIHNYDAACALILRRFPVVVLSVDQLLIEGWVWRTLCFA
jgi:hypothetical protein